MAIERRDLLPNRTINNSIYYIIVLPGNRPAYAALSYVGESYWGRTRVQGSIFLPCVAVVYTEARPCA